MKVVVHKGGGQTVEFQMDIEFEYLLNYCSFRYNKKGYITFDTTRNNIHLFLGLEYGKQYTLHRVLYYLKNKILSDNQNHIDHIDQDKTNNLLDNLRLITRSENRKNRQLLESQIYYNICQDKNNNKFIFRHHEKNHKRCFSDLKDALAYFTEYDNTNDNILTKHISNIKPISEVKLVEREPHIKCCLCGTILRSRHCFDRHNKLKHNS
jgi:hypothetical protein